MRLKTLGLLAVPLGLLLGTGTVKANTIEMNVTGYSAGVYSYSLYLTAGNALGTTPTGYESGFILPDVAASAVTFNGVATVAADWSIVTTDGDGASTLGNTTNNGTETIISGTGTGDTSQATDDPVVDDLVLKYVGAGLTGVPSSGTSILLATGTFDSAASPADLNNRITLSRDLQYNTTTTELTEHYAMPVSVPLPSAAGMGLATLVGFAGLGLIRRRRSA